jgi:ferrous iron transport protein B
MSEENKNTAPAPAAQAAEGGCTVTIALAGNPNCGKTTLFNALTGSNQYVGNWPGVTVEKKDGRLKHRKDVVVQDLPGIYSLSPYSLEEVVAREYLVEEKPDAILNIVDGTNIERNLYLTTQLVSLGIPTVVAVNMIDVVRKNGDAIDLRKLAEELGCRVVEVSALTGEGVVEAAEAAIAAAHADARGEAPHVFTGSVEHAIAHIEESIEGKVPARNLRWYAIKVFERDEKVLAALALDPDTLAHVDEHVRDCEKELDDDAESIITNQRYDYVKQVVGFAVTKKPRKGGLSLSDKVDRFVTNRILAIPIFILSLCAMWWLAVSEKGPGTILTDWANDQFLGEDGWHVPFTAHECREDGFYKGMDYEEAQEAFAPHGKNVEAWEGAYVEAFNAAHAGEEGFQPLEALGEDAGIDETLATTVVAEGVKLDDDEETGEPVEGPDGQLEWSCDYEAYKASKAVPEVDPAAFGAFVPGLTTVFGDALDRIGVGGAVKSVVLDGAWNGVSTVLGFVPVLAIVFLFLAFLEDCGYMARVAFIMDRLFRKFGLSGKSLIPMLVGKGCGVPAVMAARTIESERDRRMTIILSTFIPCGAKTVIIAMLSSLFFREMWYVAPLMDVTGVAIIVLGGIALKKTRAFAGEAAPFVMELPAYHMPTLSGIWHHTWTRVKGYVWKAGVVIFPACVFLWVVMHFDWTFALLADEEIERSILASIGGAFAWLLAPLGFGTWQGVAASVSAEIAKEQATATLGLVAANMDGASTAARIQALFATFGGFPRLSALSFMLFNLFVPPCMVAIAVTFREMGSRKWGWFAVGFQLFVGYTLALSVYRLGVLFAGGGFGIWTALALLVDAWCLWMILRRPPRAAGS